MATPNPQDLANLQAAKSGLYANLAAVCASPKPTYSVGGQNVDWAGYVQFILSCIDKINDGIQVESFAAGPLEYVTQGVS